MRRGSPFWVIGMFFLCSFLSAFEVAFEAELGEIQDPIIVDKDKEASRGEFIWVPQGRGNAPQQPGAGIQGWVDYKIFIPKKGTYYMWGRTIAPTGGDDSFFITWDTTDPKDRGVWDAGNENVWDVTESNNWFWDPISGRLGRGIPHREFKLDRGEHLLRVWHREDGTKVDAFFLADSQKAKPREPTDEEVRTQKRGMIGQLFAVSPKGKLATFWAKLKQRPSLP